MYFENTKKQLEEFARVNFKVEIGRRASSQKLLEKLHAKTNASKADYFMCAMQRFYTYTWGVFLTK